MNSSVADAVQHLAMVDSIWVETGRKKPARKYRAGICSA
jgi:hypothetical protein